MKLQGLEGMFFTFSKPWKNAREIFQGLEKNA